MSGEGDKPEKRGYYSHYLERLPTDQRLKIQQEIREKYKPALTVNNVIKALEGIDWNEIGQILNLPKSKIRSIASEHVDDKRCKMAVVSYWLFLDPMASWRRIIDFFDNLSSPGEERADLIRHYAEELTDTSLTHDNVVRILELTHTPAGFLFSCYISLFVRKQIHKERRVNQEEPRSELVQYWIDFSPYASWSRLGARLLWLEEYSALEVAKKFIKTRPETTLTPTSLSAILSTVSDLDVVTPWLAITPEQMNLLYSQLEESLPVSEQTIVKLASEYFLTHNPAPCWKTVAYALWRTEDIEALEKVQSVYRSNSESEIQRKLQVCRQAIKDKGSIDQIFMQGVFFGLPRSGKTSVKKRLVGKKVAQQQSSTGIAEKVSRVEIGRSMVKFVSRAVWNEIFDINEEATMIVEDITAHINDSDDASNNVAPHKRRRVEVPAQQPTHIQRTLKLEQVVRETRSTDPQVHQDHSKEDEDKLNEQSLPDPMQIFGAALLASRGYIRYGQLLQWTLYLSDAGGQPEFQEMLPALVSGPSLYFLTFPLHRKLNEKYMVEYQHPDGRSIVPFKASFTVKESLLSSLASIASTRSYMRVNDEKVVTPKVLFIATHKDKLQSQEQMSQIDSELQEAVKKTAAFRENMIEFCSESQMIFDLNNYSNKVDDIQHVRDAVERIGTRNDDYKIQTPYTWMIFAITLRHYPRQVIKIDECFKIGKLCGIDKEQELLDALWFLHHNVGIIRHFQEVPDLQDVVIKDPQYIFDKMTKMIVITFTFESVGFFTHQEFVKKGIIPADMLDKLSTESNDLCGEKLKVLLEHLNLITPIKENDKVVKYFVPSALSHAELPPKTAVSTTHDHVAVPSIMITFESGYVPKGIFSSLVVKLLKKDKASPFEWSLVEDRIYRNQLTLSVGPYADLFTFSLFPTHIDIDVNVTTSLLSREVTVGHVCCDVLREVKANISAVTAALHYTQKAAHSLAFACPQLPSHDHSHAANINFFPEGKPLTLSCPFTRKTHILPNNHQVWFDEKMELPPDQDTNGPAASTSVSVDQQASQESPLSAIESTFHPQQMDEKVHSESPLKEGDLASVQEALWEGRANWYNLGLQLGLTAGTLDAISEDYPRNSGRCFTATLEKWMRTCEHPSWSSLARCLRTAPVGLGDLADQIDPSKKPV